jgi:hypothetical protein
LNECRGKQNWWHQLICMHTRNTSLTILMIARSDRLQLLAIGLCWHSNIANGVTTFILQLQFQRYYMLHITAWIKVVAVFERVRDIITY